MASQASLLRHFQQMSETGVVDGTRLSLRIFPPEILWIVATNLNLMSFARLSQSCLQIHWILQPRIMEHIWSIIDLQHYADHVRCWWCRDCLRVHGFQEAVGTRSVSCFAHLLSLYHKEAYDFVDTTYDRNVLPPLLEPFWSLNSRNIRHAIYKRDPRREEKIRRLNRSHCPHCNGKLNWGYSTDVRQEFLMRNYLECFTCHIVFGIDMSASR
jgi:uncharacterized protein with PIN domain